MTDLLRQAIKDWEAAMRTLGVHTFPDSRFCWRAWILSLSISTIRVFLTVTAFVFGKFLPNTQVQITIVCTSVIPSSKNGVLWRKQLVQSGAQITTQMLFLEITKCMHLSHVIIQNAKKKLYSRIKWNWLFFFFFERTTTAKIQCRCLDLF